jgi:hypothetical protein
MSKKNHNYHGSNISFIDMLFNIIMVFVLMFFASILMMNPPAKKNEVEVKADTIITMTWPDNSPHDIDLWVKVPEGNPIGYSHKENTYLFLERDDLGANNNYVMKNDERVILATRREVATFRGKEEGRYVVNVNFYMAKTMDGHTDSAYSGPPIPVVVELIQINPVYRVLARKEIMLTSVREEKTAFSFIVNNNEITEIEKDIEEPFILLTAGTVSYGGVPNPYTER